MNKSTQSTPPDMKRVSPPAKGRRKVITPQSENIYLLLSEYCSENS